MSSAEEFLQNPAWVHRMEEAFVQLDKNKNGYLSLEDYELWVDNLENMVKPAPHLIATVRDRTKKYCAGLGIVRGKQATKGEFLKGIAALAVSERAKWLAGKETLLTSMLDSWFDVVDTNHDGTVTQDEWKTILTASDFGASAADDTFKLIDKNKNGKVERKELNDFHFKFWFTLDDADSKGMLGKRYEK